MTFALCSLPIPLLCHFPHFITYLLVNDLKFHAITWLDNQLATTNEILLSYPLGLMENKEKIGLKQERSNFELIFKLAIQKGHFIHWVKSIGKKKCFSLCFAEPVLPRSSRSDLDDCLASKNWRDSQIKTFGVLHWGFCCFTSPQKRVQTLLM